jgi:hypothetical protein
LSRANTKDRQQLHNKTHKWSRNHQNDMRQWLILAELAPGGNRDASLVIAATQRTYSS